MRVSMELRTNGLAVTDRVEAHADPLGENARGGDVEGREHGDELGEPSNVSRGTRRQGGQLNFLGEVLIVINF